MHIFLWLAYVLLKTLLNFTAEEGNHLLHFTRFVKIFNGQLILLVAKIPMVYSLFAIVEQYLKGKFSKLILTIYISLLFLLGLFLFLIVKQYVFALYMYGRCYSLQDTLGAYSLLSSIIIIVLVCSLALSFKHIIKLFDQKEKEKNVIKEKLETELKYLKAQTNPHFLFNTLNNIYGLARKKSELTSEVVLKLSELLRYTLYETNKDKVLLTQEINIIQNYVELEKIRYNDRLTVNFQIKQDDPDYYIQPLLLLPFVENAFKHGAAESRFDIIIDIRLTVINHRLHFEITNSLPEEYAINADGLGLKNSKRQLELTYPDYELEAQKKDNFFAVHLILPKI